MWFARYWRQRAKGVVRSQSPEGGEPTAPRAAVAASAKRRPGDPDRLRIDFRDGAVLIGPGEMFVVPRGFEHKPRGALNTGHVGGARTAESKVWIQPLSPREQNQKIAPASSSSDRITMSACGASCSRAPSPVSPVNTATERAPAAFAASMSCKVSPTIATSCGATPT